MTNVWLSRAMDIKEELYKIREDLHRNPELGNEEFRTTEYIDEYLKGLGIETVKVLETGLIGRLKFNGEGKTVGLRADIDALPVKENTGASFASINEGIMHACGHDTHMTAALGAAKILSEHKDELSGQAVFIFEPDEEGSGGARRMIAKGVLDGVDAVFGMHVTPDLPAGEVGIKYGKFYAASDMFDIFVKGKTAHGATPEKGIDALQAAAKVAIRLHDIPSNYSDRCILTIGTLNAGTKENTVAGDAKLTGIIRTLGPEMRRDVKAKLKEVCQDVSKETGTEIEVVLKESYGGIVNTDAETEFAKAAAMKVIGPDKVHILEKPNMTTEDFGYFVEECGGAFYHIGAGCDKALHSDEFLPQKEMLPVAAAFHAGIIAGFLNGDL